MGRDLRQPDQREGRAQERGSGFSACAFLACVPSWVTDCRADVAKADVPALILHGTGERIPPIHFTGGRSACASAMLGGDRGSPHGRAALAFAASLTLAATIASALSDVSAN
jgi:hypothetical protein